MFLKAENQTGEQLSIFAIFWRKFLQAVTTVLSVTQIEAAVKMCKLGCLLL